MSGPTCELGGPKLEFVGLRTEAGVAAGRAQTEVGTGG